MARYYNPFPGKPAPVEFSGLFLFYPDVMLKLVGESMSASFSEMDEQSLYKRLRRVRQGKQKETPQLRRDLLAKLSSENPRHKKFRLALEGDECSQQEVSNIGEWECYITGQGNNSIPHHLAFLIDIERACAQPLKLITQGRYPLAAHLLEQDELMSRILWPEALRILKTSADAKAILPLQASVAMEVHLSHLASWDAEHSVAPETGDESQLICILPSSRTPNRNPASLFFRWLVNEIGVKSASSMLNDDRAIGLSLDPVTLMNWNRGRHYPNILQLQSLVAAFLSNVDHTPAWNRYWGAKYLGFLGYLAEMCSEKARRLIGTEQETALAPWPALPFGYPTFEAWCQARYPYWFDFHMRRGPESSEKRG